MGHCIACGRELTGQGELCPECQAQGHIHPTSPPATRRPKQTPKVTLFFIGLNVLLFVMMVASGVNAITPAGGSIFDWGGNQGFAVMARGQYWRLLTSNYVHIGMVHLLVNMYGLWLLGPLVEIFYKRKDYLLLFTYTGLSGSVLSMGMHPYVTSAGASGAIFGLAGTLLTTFKFGHLPLPADAKKNLFQQILLVSVVNLVLGIRSGVDNAGHLGGFLAGLLVGAVMGRRLDSSETSADYRTRAWIGLWVGLVAAFWLVVAWRTGLFR
jgi:rhomboid protease GluP